MPPISISVVIDRPPNDVWEDVRHIASHVEWMADAYEIRFLSEQREGVGTRFECLTRVGPLRTTDVMEITAWDPGRRMGVRHQGVVTGEGAFTLEPVAGNRTEFRWSEQLRFPWWLGGRLGERAGGPVLRLIWKRNLTRLRRRLERTAA
jgi:uncharacterized protein YndB with AHSA1/START domain